MLKMNLLYTEVESQPEEKSETGVSSLGSQVNML